MEKWRNKVAVVTGASAGIGAACCIALVENGMNVVGLARRQERIEQLRDTWPGEKEKQQRLHALKCDVRNEVEVVETFEKIVQEYGAIAVLINNAGIVRDTQLIKENNTQDLRDTMDTNVMGVVYCTREAFKTMSKNENSQGHVILINSVGGHSVVSFPGLSLNLYAASKYALTAMTEVYRNEFLMNNTKIKITSISPGLVKSELFPERAEILLKDAPILESSDVADAVVYCLQTPPHVQVKCFHIG
ncbi:farnesol dehydrogenase-like [Calliphora vicina]|uniref:farnesol dehydrogenase-like n=1 Tax=Calliphora vicina TaxID=7373 RepID=UPI00325BBCFC